MRILVSNDDGYQAPGIVCLARCLAPIAEITVIAPERDRSGASNSLTLDYPIRARRAENGFIHVDGTPTDCVHLGITGLMEQEPDMVVAGINAGANLGDDVLYSGTVAAAMEGRFLGRPAMAVSLAGEGLSHYESAAAVVLKLIERPTPVPPDTILNVNVPDLPLEEIAGFRVTRLGHRHKAEPMIRERDPRGREIFWVGPPGAQQDAGPDTDFHAVSRGYVSITPLHVDLTRYATMEELTAWVSDLDLGLNPRFTGIGMTSQRTRDRLVERLQAKGITSSAVLEVIARTPRHIFVDEALASRAYEDSALPIGHGQTISQPYIVARMSEILLAAGPLASVLEVGTGCGYQTAVLAQLVQRVYSVERIQALLNMARERMYALGLNNVRLSHSDGTWGWDEHAPYDGILVGAAPGTLPQALLDQLAPAGRLVIPVGSRGEQKLVLAVRETEGVKLQSLDAVSFVPMLGGTG